MLGIKNFSIIFSITTKQYGCYQNFREFLKKKTLCLKENDWHIKVDSINISIIKKVKKKVTFQLGYCALTEFF